MPKNNGISILIDFSINDFIEDFRRIKAEILLKNNIIQDINEKDLKLFLFIIKNFGSRIIYNIKYFSKSNLHHFINTKLSKNIFINNISLLFILLFLQYKTSQTPNNNSNAPKSFKNLYKYLFNIIDNIYNYSKLDNNENRSSVLEIKDIFDIIRLNILLGLNDLPNKSFIFNLSIHYLIKTYFANENNKDIESHLNLLMNQIYTNLLNSEKNLHFLRRDNNLDSFTILYLTTFLSSSKLETNLIETTKKILLLIYKNNYSSLISDYILDRIKECFYELKENNNLKIVRCIQNLYGFTKYLNDLFIDEELDEIDPFKPSTCFVFGGNNYSGINYNPNTELLKKNFTLIFSFQINEIKENVIYPLITFVNCDRKDIIFNISVENNLLKLYCNGDQRLKEIGAINKNRSYLIIVENKSTGILKDKIKIIINNSKYEISGSINNHKTLCSINIGNFPSPNENGIFKNVENFKGIMGPIIQFSTTFEDKNFIPNIQKLKGYYDLMLIMNKKAMLDFNFNFESCEYFRDKNINSAKNYFIEISKKITDDFQYSICPLSMINNHNTLFFCQDIYNKSTKSISKEIFPDFTTLVIPSSKFISTYAKKNQKSLSTFVEYDGISIYTLIVEYFYNILRMLINKPKKEKIELCNEIYNVLNLIISGIFKILAFFKLDDFSHSIDTFGFSIKKVFNLLNSIQPLNESLINTIGDLGTKLMKYYDNLNNSRTKDIILSFLSKFVSLISSSKFLTISDYSNSELLFKFINSVVEKNHDLINESIIKELLIFSYVLDPISFDEYNKKPAGTTNSTNKEYKKMKKAYKNLMKNFILNSNSLKLYINYFQNIFSNQRAGWTAKYELIKIYYKFHKVQTLYNDNENKDSNKFSINNSKKEKSNKNDIGLETELLNEYQNSFIKLVDIQHQKDEENSISLELIKAILILLIYEHKIIIPLNIFNDKKESSNIKEKKNDFQRRSSIKSDDKSGEEITFFSSFSLEQIKTQVKNNLSMSYSLSTTLLTAKSGKEEFEVNNYKLENLSYDKDNQSDSFELKDSASININNENNLFDSFLNSKNYSFYTIKGIFACLCEKWDKKTKINFIKTKDESLISFKDCILIFDRFIKELFNQFLSLIECINNEDLLKKCFKLIFSFIFDSIFIYTVDFSNKKNKSLFLHLLESSSMINNFLSFSLNNDIIRSSEFKNYVLNSIKYINNSVLLYHPRPYIFSLIKSSLKSHSSETFLLIDYFCGAIVDILKLQNSKLNRIFFQNFIHFIKTLLKILDKNPKELQELLLKNNYELFYSIQNFAIDMAKNDTIFDPNLYAINPYLTSQNKKDKNDKIFQLSSTKLLNNQIIYINLFQIALNSIYLLWKSQDKDKNVINISLDYISKIHKELIINGHFCGYFIDLMNPYFKINNKYLAQNIPENIKKLFINDINYNSKQKDNPSVRETKIVSFSLFLIIMKYQSLLIKYERAKINDNKEELIKKAFEPLISLSENEINFYVPNVTKLKENKKLEIIIEREESKSKEFKNFNNEYYKYFLEKINNKNYDMTRLKEEIENKFIKDEEEKDKISRNLLNSEPNPNYNDSKSDKKEKLRKSSFWFYGIENDLDEEKIKTPNNKDKNNKETKYIINKETKHSLDFESSKFPILCTKRDLILKNFGYFYYKHYFKSNKFIKLKKVFFYQNNPNDKNNNYFGFEKIMKNQYPFITKNFSNYINFYPKVFYRPYHKLFENKYFKISHPYFKNEIFDKSNEEKKMHLEFGHGLLNQSNFELYTKANNNEEINEDTNSCLSKERNNDINIFNLESILDSLQNEIKPYIYHDDSSINKNLNQNIFKGSIQKNMTISPKISNPFNNKSNIQKSSKNQTKIKFECEHCSPGMINNGFLVFAENFLIFQVNTKFNKKNYEDNPAYLIACSESDLEQEEKQIIIPYNLIAQILYRKFLFYDVALEIFLHNGKSYYFNFYNINNKNNFMNIILEKINKDIVIKNSIEYFEKNKYLNKWLEGTISTLDYLLLINKYSDRSYNSLSHYLILPWLFSNYNDIYNSENIRNFKYPGFFKTKEELDSNVKENEDDGFSFHFMNLFTNYMYVNHYLFRTYPYINNQIKLQENEFDHPERQFNSLENTFFIFKEYPQINMELIPEFYFIPELFLNLNYCYYGKCLKENNNCLVNNYGIGPSFHFILEIINYHQLNINSEKIISRLHKWIDYVFGENQISIKKDSIYNFPRECYEDFVTDEIKKKCQIIKIFNKIKNKEEIGKQVITEEEITEENLISKLKETKDKIKQILYKTLFYGHCPTQIFTKAHPACAKKIEPKIYNFSNMDNLQIILKNAIISLDKKDIYYMQESSKGNYFYIVCEHEILVFNKNLKINHKLSINYISKIPDFFSIKYHMKNNYFKILYNYKYIIFDIFDCKYFFVGGFLDNSLRIYYKEKDKDALCSIYNDSQIKCIRSSNYSQMFFTGHENGKIIKWRYMINPDNNQLNILKVSSIRGHKSSIKMIELNEKYECIISIDVDEIIFIRKIFDYELLSFIKINKNNKKVIDINIFNQIIILTVFKIKMNEIFLYTYSSNGLKLGKISVQLKLPITIIPQTDEMIIFSVANIYFAKVALNEKASLIAISKNLEISDIDSNLEEDTDIANNFNKDLHNSDPISYFYDSKNRVLFCMFANGILYRINFVKNV